MNLDQEKTGNAVTRHVKVRDTRLWRIVHHYRAKSITALNLKRLKDIGLHVTYIPFRVEQKF